MSPFTSALDMFQQSIHKQLELPRNIVSNGVNNISISRYPESGKPKLSIITIHGNLQPFNGYIDVERIFNAFMNCNSQIYIDLTRICKGETDGYKLVQIQSGINILSLDSTKFANNTVTRESKISSTKGFPHGCSFKAIPYSDQSRVIDIKLFKKGKLQATGCKSLEEMYILASKIIGIIFIASNYTAKYTFVNPVLSMIKANFNANFKIDLDKLVKIIDSNYTSEITRNYSPEFRGLTLKWIAPFCTIENGKQQRVTFVIHSSGNIALMCNKDQSNVIKCWNYINNILKTHYEDIVIPS